MAPLYVFVQLQLLWGPPVVKNNGMTPKPTPGYSYLKLMGSGDHTYLLGGWTTHLKNMRKSDWIISLSRGEHKKTIFETPT